MARKTLTTQSTHLGQYQDQVAPLDTQAEVLVAEAEEYLVAHQAAVADHLAVAEDAPLQGDQQALGRAVLGVGRAVLPPVRSPTLKLAAQV